MCIIPDHKLYKIKSPNHVSRLLANMLISHPRDSKVLWLVSGGSAIGIAVKTAELLSGADVSKLTVSLADERYGEPGHEDSNWAQLIKAGFSLAGAKLYPVLDGSSAEDTTRKYNQFLKKAFSQCDYALALLGIGADGHTAGLLPGSPALNSKAMAVYYKHRDYQRITITPAGLSNLDEAVVYAAGESKREALTMLTKDLPVKLQPAQIIKQIPVWNVYNDLLGEEL